MLRRYLADTVASRTCVGYIPGGSQSDVRVLGVVLVVSCVGESRARGDKYFGESSLEKIVCGPI